MAGWWQQHRITIGTGLLSAVLGAGLALLLMRPAPPPVRVVQPTVMPTPNEALVHVGGAVNAPGVYRLPGTARVKDALEAAGGATLDGDPNAVNLAARVRDGQRIEIPERGQALQAQVANGRTDTGGQPNALINLNRADAAQLDSLPGVGAVTARRILDYRERVGPFERVDQLLDAHLVNRGVFDRIKDLVSVE